MESIVNFTAKTVNGENITPLALPANTSVAALKQAIVEKLGWSSDSVKLIFSGAELNEKDSSGNDNTLTSCHIQKDCTVYLIPLQISTPEEKSPITEIMKKAAGPIESEQPTEAQKKSAEQKKIAEDKKVIAERKAARQKLVAEEKKAVAEEKKAVAEEKKAAAEKKSADQKKIAEEKKAAAEKKSADQKKIAEEKKLLAEKKAAIQKVVAEEKKSIDQVAPAEKKSVDQNKSIAEKKSVDQKKVSEEKIPAEKKKEISGVASTSSYDIKICFDNGIVRRFSIPNNGRSYSLLIQKLEILHPGITERLKANKILLQYVDNEKDKVTISSDAEFIYFAEHKPKWTPKDSLLRLEVVRRISKVDPTKVELSVKNKPNFVSTVANRDLVVGDIIRLKSVASNKYVTIRKATHAIDAKGAEGKVSLFKVTEISSDSFVKLQNVADPKCWLRIKDGKLDGTGKGGKLCEFVVVKSADGIISLKSVAQPEFSVAFGADGSPKEMGDEKESSFVLLLVTKQKA